MRHWRTRSNVIPRCRGALWGASAAIFGPDSNIKHALDKKAPRNKQKRKYVLGNLKRGVVITPTLSLPDTAFTHAPDTSLHTRVTLCKCVRVCVCIQTHASPPRHVLRVMIKAQQTSRTTSPAALLQKYTRLSRLAPHCSACEERGKRVPFDEYTAHVMEGRRRRSNTVAIPGGTCNSLVDRFLVKH